MAWTRLDDRWDDSEKLAEAAEALADHGDSAFAMWSRAVTFCNRGTTDGRISGAKLRGLTKHRRPQVVVDALVRAGAIVDIGDNAYEVHDFLDWNESREAIEARRLVKLDAASRGGIAKRERARQVPVAEQSASTVLHARQPSGTALECPSPSPLRILSSPSAPSETDTQSAAPPPAVGEARRKPDPIDDIWAAYIAGAVAAGRQPHQLAGDTPARRATIRARIADCGREKVLAAARGVWVDSWAKPGGTCGSPAGKCAPEYAFRNIERVEAYAASWEAHQETAAAPEAGQRDAAYYAEALGPPVRDPAFVARAKANAKAGVFPPMPATPAEQEAALFGIIGGRVAEGDRGVS